MTMELSRRRALTLLGLGSLAAAGSAAPLGAVERKWATTSPRERARQRYFPNLQLTAHDGRKLKFYDDLIKDKLVVLNFMYATCEGVCPKVMSNLARVHTLLGDRMGRDIFFYSFTLRPDVDTPEVLAEHAAMHKVKPGWLLLTGQPEDLELLRVKLGFVDPDPEIDKDKSSHVGNVRYGNEPLMRWGACPGMSDPDWIAESILWVDWPREDVSPSSPTEGGQT